jgi:hypothetical protein
MAIAAHAKPINKVEILCLLKSPMKVNKIVITPCEILPLFVKLQPYSFLHCVSLHLKTTFYSPYRKQIKLGNINCQVLDCFMRLVTMLMYFVTALIQVNGYHFLI